MGGLTDVVYDGLTQIFLNDFSVPACEVIIEAGYTIYSLNRDELYTIREKTPENDVYPIIEHALARGEKMYVAYVPEHVAKMAEAALAEARQDESEPEE